MVKEIEKLLASLGLKYTEIQVFLAVIQVGPAVISKIARKAGINRASAYDIVRRLLLKGLVRGVSTRGVKKYEAVDPINILEKLEENKNLIEKEVKIFEKLKPELNALYGQKYDKPSVKFYDGIQGVKSILMDTLDDSRTREILSYASADYLEMGFGKDFLDNYWRRRTDMKIPTRGIIPETPEAKKIFTPEKNLKELRQLKFISPEKYTFTNEIDIYADKVSIISLDPDNIYGVIIQSTSMADTQRNIYELLWNSLQ